jgi:DNA-binding NarL/FixJ family response regulator
MCLFAGEMGAARSLSHQVQIVTDASDARRLPNSTLFLAAFRGDQLEVRRLTEAITRDAQLKGEGLALTRAQWAMALVCNGNGQYEEAFRASSEAVKDPNDFWYWGWATVERIEAASRTNRAESARSMLERLSESTDASGTEWALAVQARCRALLSDGADAEAHYQEAIERLLPTRLRVDLARTRLLYGEWLRRQHRQRDAREQLRRSHELFLKSDMSGFAGRAEAELLATGERARRRTVDTQVDLTPQESRISELAAQGATNQDIAEQLFISPATVEYHLSKVYRKFGIRSRTQLGNVLRSISVESGSIE